MLSYEVLPGQGPHLLLVHGALSNSAQWRPNLSALSKFCRPVVVELLGHGDSPAPTNATAYHPEAYLSYFERIRTELAAQHWFLCGYSLGAALSINYVLSYPERTRGILFTNSMSAFVDEQQTERWREDAIKTGAAITKSGLTAIEKMPVHPRHAIGLPRDVLEPLVARAKLLNPDGVAHMLATTVPNASVRNRFHQCQVPAMLLNGTREKRFQPFAEFAIQQLSGLAVRNLDAGHGVNMQAGDAFNACVQEFITTCLT